MTQTKFLQTLFDLGERTCYAYSKYDTYLTPWPRVCTKNDEDSIFFSINPMISQRADDNVTCYRNILLEADNMPLEQQIEYVTSKVPVTSIVYSGGKSYHFIISLADPCSTREEYDILVRRLHKLLPEIDPTTKNPSRFSRLPGATRPDTQRLQQLLQLNSRISQATLEPLLPLVAAPKTHDKPPQGFFSPLVVDSMFYPETVMRKVGIESRNQYFFWLGQRLLEAVAPLDQRLSIVDATYGALKDKSDFSLKEARMAARVG